MAGNIMCGQRMWVETGEAVGEAFRGVDPLSEGAPCVFRYKIERCDAVRLGICTSCGKVMHETVFDRATPVTYI